MPTYEYKCNKCGHGFEVFQSIKAKPVKKCPECGGSVKKLISSNAGIIFKGTGFYQTDYKNTSKPKNNENIPPCGKNESCSSCKHDE